MSELCYFVNLYRSRNQSQDDFETFVYNFEMMLEILAQKNPFLRAAFGGFDANFKTGIIKTKQASKVTQLKI